METFELQQRERVEAVLGASFWQNPALHGQVLLPRSQHDRAESLPRLRQAVKNYPPLLANAAVINRIVQVGLWFAGEPEVDRFLFDALRGQSAAQHAGLARVLREHPNADSARLVADDL